MITEKYCSKCDTTKPVSEFHKSKSRYDGFGGYCKHCHKASYATPEYMRANHQKRRYGLTEDAFYALYKAQECRCPICGTSLDIETRAKGGLYAVDHNHDTKEVRGILCSPCNRALGLFRDRQDLLMNAARYLEQRGSYGQRA